MASAACPFGRLCFASQGGGELPALGYGTAHIHDVGTIRAAIEAGFRHIDTAQLYGNQRAVGEAVAKCSLPRSELFVTTKVSFWGKGGEQAALRRSLEELGLEYVDLCLMHTPLSGSWVEFVATFLPHRLGRHQPLAWGPLRALAPLVRRLLRGVDGLLGWSAASGARLRQAAWRELEGARAAGMCRYIGVSNFDAGLLRELEATAQVLPAVNQIERHPRWQAREAVAHCRERGIAVIGYGNGLCLDLEEAAAVAAGRAGAAGAAGGVSPAQVSLAWALQSGAGALARSSRRAGMDDNLAALGVTLTPRELELLDGADTREPFYWDVSFISEKAAAQEQEL